MSARAENAFSAFSLVDLLLAEQQDLAPVERFARYHDSAPDTRTGGTPPPARVPYRELIPLSRPKAGEQYSFAVDLDRCSGCKACVSACHSLNGLEENEMWRSVGLIVGDRGKEDGRSIPYQQTITTACHHCVDPACAEGCPVLAYDKDPLTGIVRHLDDQCIGCQYCILKCPYDVPKFSASKGIVRKCDMCHSRLAVGEAPACVQACPHEAIRIEIVNQQVIRASASTGSTMIPGAFDSALTLPATRYQSTKRIPFDAVSADDFSLHLESAHWPLVLMLVLTQLAVGGHLLNVFVQSRAHSHAHSHLLHLISTVALFSGLGVSIFHLGRPLKAWRAFLGWRNSWMSREIIAFSAYGAAALAGLAIPSELWLSALTASLGMIAVFSSAMIYIDTCRSVWSSRMVLPRFFGSVALLGATAGAALCGWLQPAPSTPPTLAPFLACVAAIIRATLFCWERRLLQTAAADPASPSHRSVLIALRLRPGILRLDTFLFGLSSIFFLMVIAQSQGLGASWGTLAFLSTCASQLLERYLFFATANAPRMPGSLPGHSARETLPV
ncbi:MAG TPA: DmsC/YnfH family molybdoenzyme membrane anchor subunit [Verrucomicrobiae bacterium]|jgi:Fe-S-cluster-containing dehydrogenase component/DMSO reductase anchor subunit|nr:DmsC/YnfH family molybdoenzyme membrane anchor subunit [Verrucomicrobiae bacterium]